MDLPKLVTAATAAQTAPSPMEKDVFSPARSTRQARIIDSTGDPIACASPPHANEVTASPSTNPSRTHAASAGPARPSYTRRQSSVSANTLVELPLGSGDVQSVVARRKSTNPTLLATGGGGRSLSWFAGAPRANTIEEDLQEEVLEEKQERAQMRNISPLEQFSAELMRYLEDNKTLRQRRDIHGTAHLEDQEAVARRQRDAQLAGIEQRRAVDQKKFDLVDDMYDRAIQRRYRAMQKIAADPPADRLIGHNMMQYVPASLVPGYAPDHVGEHARTHNAGRDAASEKAPSAQRSGVDATQDRLVHNAVNPIVFLTELDGAQPRCSDGDGAVEATAPGRAKQASEDFTTRARSHKSGRGDGTDHGRGVHATAASSMRPPDALVQQWRELGYDVTYIDAQGKVLPKSSSSTRRASNTRVGPASVAANAPTPGTYNDEKWMKLAPLPGVCLVQKRLAIDVPQKAPSTSQAAESMKDNTRRTKTTKSSMVATTGSSSPWTFGGPQ